MSDAENAGFAGDRQPHHFIRLRKREVTRQGLVGRDRCRNENHLGQVESVPHLFGNAEMGDMNGIEGAAKNADSHVLPKLKPIHE